MKQQPDKLFSDKLASYSRPAPTRAWDAIEAGLDKRSRKGLWLKLAASLLLLATATYVLWQVYGSRTYEPTRNLAGTRPAVQQQAPAVSDPVTPDATHTTPSAQNISAEASHLSEAIPHTPVQQKTQRVQPEQSAPVNTQRIPEEATVAIGKNENIAQTTATLPEPVIEEAVITETQAVNTHTAAVTASNASAGADKNITLVYSAREADGYLDKKGLAEATSEDEKPSTLKKLLKKAADLKSNQDPLGELRQRKNEILALNFRSEKQRGQNK